MSEPREAGLKAVEETHRVLDEIEDCIEGRRYRDAAEWYAHLGTLAAMGQAACARIVQEKSREN